MMHGLCVGRVGFREARVRSFGQPDLGLLRQDKAHGYAPDFQPAGDFGFADARTMCALCMASVEGCRQRPASAIQSPHEHAVDLATARGLQ